jgi:hypothetical protein
MFQVGTFSSDDFSVGAFGTPGGWRRLSQRLDLACSGVSPSKRVSPGGRLLPMGSIGQIGC